MRRRIKQVLINLLSNANKFTPEGGKITLIAAAERSGAITFAVTDTGIGMTADQIAHCAETVRAGRFRLFAQASGRHRPGPSASPRRWSNSMAAASSSIANANAGTTVAFTLPQSARSKDILS